MVPERRGLASSGRSRAKRAAADVRERFGIAAPFILSVGDLQPRKNQIGLIRAFARLVRAYPQLKHESGAGRQGDLVRRAGARGGARIAAWPTASSSAASSPTPTCCSSTTPAIFSSSLRSTKASACRRWKRWRAAARWSARTPPRCPKWWTARRFCSIRTRWTRSSRAMADLLLDAELRARMERLGLQRAAHFQLAEDGAADALEFSTRCWSKSRAASAVYCAQHHSSSMTISFRRYPSALPLACAAAWPAGAPRTKLTGFPFQNETLRYTRQLARAASAGRRHLYGAQSRDGGWSFDVSLDAGVPGFADHGHATSPSATPELCSVELERDISHGSKKVTREDHVRSEEQSAHAQTTVPGGRRQDRIRHSHPARATRWPSFISPGARWGRAACRPRAEGLLRPRLRRADATTPARMTVRSATRPAVTDHVDVSVKGPRVRLQLSRSSSRATPPARRC